MFPSNCNLAQLVHLFLTIALEKMNYLCHLPQSSPQPWCKRVLSGRVSPGLAKASQKGPLHTALANPWVSHSCLETQGSSSPYTSSCAWQSEQALLPELQIVPWDLHMYWPDGNNCEPELLGTHTPSETPLKHAALVFAYCDNQHFCHRGDSPHRTSCQLLCSSVGGCRTVAQGREADPCHAGCQPPSCTSNSGTMRQHQQVPNCPVLCSTSHFFC